MEEWLAPFAESRLNGRKWTSKSRFNATTAIEAEIAMTLHDLRGSLS